MALAASVLGGAFAQSLKSISGANVPRPVCKASDKVEKSFVPPPADFLLKSANSTCDIVVTYSDNFPEEAKIALERAITIWESMIASDIPIHLRARWRSNLGTNVLASCGPETYYANFENAPFEGRYYPVAVAEKIAGQELNGESRTDIDASFSSQINWYYGVDGNTPVTSYDFVSIALHEIAHGLGFTGFFGISGNLGYYSMDYGTYGDATTFDLIVEEAGGKQLVDESLYANPSSLLKSAFTSGYLYANSPVAKKSDSGIKPRLYSPEEFNSGSSIYHLNDNTYPSGTENSLMTHAFGRGEAIHDPGPLAMGIMEDIGWTNLFLRFSPTKDKETIGSIDFVLLVESYYSIDTSSLVVIYSTDNFVSTRDTLQLFPTQEDGVFSANFEPSEGTVDIQYYVSAMDVKDRVRMAPSQAPDEVYVVHFGVDTESPVVEHTFIPYFILSDEQLIVQAEVDDNLGIDTVYVTYSINDISQPAFGLTRESGTSYSGSFNFNTDELRDGDLITYSIVAKDASNAQNTTMFPNNGSIEFLVEQIYDPVTNYTNDFNQTSSDFILSDFRIYQATTFENGALNSPHPYPSPEEDNSEYDFITFLKYPIIIQEDGVMSFDEVVLVEPGGNDSYGEFQLWDYVIVEGSEDFGESWYPLTDGYDSGDNTTWEQEYDKGVPNGEQDSETLGTDELYVNRSISLLESGNFSVGDTILIRFRLYSDPYARGWGWAIDNLIIQQPLAAKETILSPGNVNAYPNPFNNNFEIEVNPKAPLKEMRIELYDMYGRSLFVINKQNVTSYRETIDMQKYSSGLFLLKVIEDGQPVLSKKMIKN